MFLFIFWLFEFEFGLPNRLNLPLTFKSRKEGEVSSSMPLARACPFLLFWGGRGGGDYIVFKLLFSLFLLPPWDRKEEKKKDSKYGLM